MKRIMIVLLALMAATLFTTSAFAADRVEVKVTSEPIAQFSESDKAGGYTLEFDEGTILNSGDLITIDLPLNVTLATDIDIMIPWAGANIANAAAQASPVVGSAVLAGADTIRFYITGTAGTQRVSILVDFVDAAAPTVSIPAATLTVTDVTVGTPDVFTVAFFDQNIVGVFVDDTTLGNVAAGAYDDPAAVGDNTRCINVKLYAGTTVNDSLDSAGDKFTFIPSNPQVAHVVTPNTFGLTVPKDSDTITIGSKTPIQGGATESCNAFDFETATAYCAAATAPNYAIITGLSDFDAATYSVKMEILTTGVYFTNAGPGVATYATAALAETAAKVPTIPAAGAGFLAAPVYDVAPAAPNANECDVATTAATKTVTQSVAIGGSVKALLFNIPSFNYDVDEVTTGSAVQVKITITKQPCGSVTTQTVTVGTMGCAVAGVSTSMIFPYFTAITGDSFWDGYAIVNKSSSAGTATLMIYEADGDVFQVTVPVAANSMAVQLTSDLLVGATVVSGSGTLGDSRFYMTVSADFDVDGFAMMADPATGESMGYLPRN